jgi:hypothetical protein
MWAQSTDLWQKVVLGGDFLPEMADLSGVGFGSAKTRQQSDVGLFDQADETRNRPKDRDASDNPHHRGT